MSLPDPIELQRLRFQQGQQLRGRDFRDQIAIEAQLRWWHNRSLHNAYGIAGGFTVEQRTESIMVHPGLAYDCRGRELILQQPRAVPLPSQPQPWGAKKLTLVASYRETTSFPRRDSLSGVCGAASSLFMESPEFSWKPTRLLAVTDGVPIAQVLDDDGKLTPDEEFVAPRSRAMARPRIVSGATIPGSTAWSLWSVPEIQTRTPALGVQVRIDTTAAGFTQTPCYFAWLQGALWRPNTSTFLAAAFAHIADPSISGFTFRLWLPSIETTPGKQRSNRFFTRKFLPFAQKQNLYVSWLGIMEAPDYFSALNDKGVTHEHTG
jgi:hypothetical protein